MDENNLQLPFPGAAEEYKYNGTVCFVYQKAQGVGGGVLRVCNKKRHVNRPPVGGILISTICRKST